jgi:hypothetical protein
MTGTKANPMLAPATIVTVEAAIEQAWAALRKNAAVQALQISHQLMVQKKATRSQLPWTEASLVLALNEHLSGCSADAAQRLYGIMSSVPASDIAMQLYLTMLREQLSKAQASGFIREPGRIVLGLGTGRSGSTSLSYLFAAQADTCFSHEHAPLIPWYQGRSQLNFHLTRMALLSRLYSCVADVSHWWLPKLDAVIHKFPRARIVVTRRDRQETIDSFLAIKGAHVSAKPINHWMKHDGNDYQRNLWDICYPKFDAESLPHALRKYWDDYYEKAESFQSRYPRQVKIFDINQISSASGQQEILEFCGYTDGTILSEPKKNIGSTHEGRSFWKNPFQMADEP